MKLTIRTLTGGELDVEVEPTDTVQIVKEKIEEQQGIPPDQQRLVFNGKQM